MEEVSVIISGYTMDRAVDMVESIEAIRNQTYPPELIEVIAVADNNEELAEYLRSETNANVVLTDRQRGCPGGRNVGAEHAQGDVLLFLDDDAVPDPQWVEQLMQMLGPDELMVGGRMEPLWESPQPVWFPDEFLWLVGCTPERPKTDTYIRNAYGSNFGIRQDTFWEVGGFPEETGRKGDNFSQGAETLLCQRVTAQTNKKVRYTDDAVVRHRIYDYRTDPEWLIRRAIGQGVSKAQIGVDEGESDYLRTLAAQGVGGRFVQLAVMFTLTIAVGVGYLKEKI